MNSNPSATGSGNHSEGDIEIAVNNAKKNARKIEKEAQEAAKEAQWLHDFENGSGSVDDEVDVFHDLERDNSMVKATILEQIENVTGHDFSNDSFEFFYYSKWREIWEGDEAYLILFLIENNVNVKFTMVRRLLSLEFLLQNSVYDHIRGLVSLHGTIDYYAHVLSIGYFKTDTSNETNNLYYSFLNKKLDSLLVNRLRKLLTLYIDFIENHAFNGAHAFNLVYHFNLKDSDGRYLNIRPLGEDKWVLSSMFKNEIVRESKISGVLEDASSYLGMPLTTHYHNSHVLLERDEELKPVQLPEEVMLLKEDMLKDFIIFGQNSEGFYGREIMAPKHLLIVGQSGSGKSVLQQTIIAQIYENLDLVEHLYLIDLKGGVEFFEHLDKEKTTVVEEVHQLLSITEEVVSKVYERFKYLKDNKIKSYDGPKIFFIVDEFAQINYWRPETRELQTEKSKLKSNLNILSTLGRAAGIRLICGLQRCTTDEMDSGFKNNLHDRILMKSNHSNIYDEVFGGHEFDDVILPKASSLKPGEILYLQDGDSHPRHLKVPVVAD